MAGGATPIAEQLDWHRSGALPAAPPSDHKTRGPATSTVSALYGNLTAAA
jgi:hypothetical protein